MSSGESSSEGAVSPLGLNPRYLWLEARVKDIVAAMDRYAKARKPCPQSWVKELVVNLNALEEARAEARPLSAEDEGR